MASRFRIRRASESDVDALADVLVDCVEGGASVSFMAPLGRERAVGFWRAVLGDAARGARVVLVAEEPGTGRVVGTVQVVLSMPDNQPHRGEIAKLLVHRTARRHGLGAELMAAAESEAEAAGKTLLVLDTAAGQDAERLYARLGWSRCGVIPDYALLPHGGLCGTAVFFRRLPGRAPDAEPGVATDPAATPLPGNS
jgi:GNAT superfamily N-acetyltransferase